MTHTRRLTSSERRAAIVREAVRLFAERGFRGTTTRELAAAVGVTEPVLYEHFRTKRELYEAILELKSGEGGERFRALAEKHLVSGDDQGYFESLADAVLEFYEANPDYVRLLMFSALESEDLGALFYRRHRDLFLGPMVEFIERRIREGVFRDLDAQLAARMLAGVASQFGLQRVLFGGVPPKMERVELARAVADIFLRGVVRETAPEK